MTDTPSDKMKRAEERFRQFSLTNPGARFSDFYVAQNVAKIRAGKLHSTLGTIVQNPSNRDDAQYLDEAGRSAAERYVTLFSIDPHQALVDYGCGSLRLGLHFIRHLNAGKYVGLDLTRDFIDMGLKTLPADLLQDKQPEFGVIGSGALWLRKTTTGPADIVISNAVTSHVHPDQMSEYARNLRKLAIKPRARVLMQAVVSENERQFSPNGWAWSEKTLERLLRPLTFVGRHGGNSEHPRRAGAVSSIFEFRNDA